MTRNIKKLAEIGSPPIEAAAADPQKLSSAFGQEQAQILLQLLGVKNGFYAFEGALHVLSVDGNGQEHGILHWNSPELWRSEYADLTEGCLFFAEDVFGVQFCLRDGHVHTFDPETGGAEPFTDDLDGWAQKILSNYNLWTGYSLALKWQQTHGSIPIGSRLLPKAPFVMGGAYDASNLYALNAVEGMKVRGCVATQIRDLPDGTKVKLKVV